jgi:hypothetical protein
MRNGNKRAIIRGSQSLLSTTQNHKLYWFATQAVPAPAADRRRLIVEEEEMKEL